MYTVYISVQFSHSVVSNTLPPHGPQHTRLPCPSPTPGACSNSCLSSQWCHPTISSSVAPFSSRLQSFPASGSLPMSRLLEGVMLKVKLQYLGPLCKQSTRESFVSKRSFFQDNPCGLTVMPLKKSQLRRRGGHRQEFTCLYVNNWAGVSLMA